MSDYYEPLAFSAQSGETRKVGFELEFGNLAIADTAAALQQKLGGTLEEINPFRVKLHDSAAGEVKIERDTEWLTSTKHRDFLAKLDIDLEPDRDTDTLLREIEAQVDRLSSVLIPCEVVTAPLAYADFTHVDEIVAVLNDLDARGTQDSLAYAFGLHLNPSLPEIEAQTLVAVTQAFLLLTDWIQEDAGVDFSRRVLTSYIDPFPDDYVDLVLAEDYRPSLQQFCDDYLRCNPTRNRALDLLPILCEYDQQRVRDGVNEDEKGLLSARPAFHYRLPDCRLGDDGWSVAAEWNRWWRIEKLAVENELRRELIAARRKNKDQFFLTRKKKWIECVADFLAEHVELPRGDDG